LKITTPIYLLCLLLAVQSGIAAFIQNDKIVHLNETAPADLELICTGSSMKWISVSQTQLAGHFVFVDFAKEDQQTHTPSLDTHCPVALIADAQSKATFYLAVFEPVSVILKAITQHLYQRPYTLFPYRKAQPRSPPFFG